ncbi:MAG: DAK2 domain-containing protein [Oscillospiraceae bacterium]|nr:DAK2 domain-containing protein [Oscillospiraceae bacterium]
MEGMIPVINGSLLKNAFISAAVTISNNKRTVDELNVYPVPDGDTGTNMSMTLGNALTELSSASDDISASEAADICASAMLRGARGNSGVILSLLFRGFAKGFSGKDEIGCDDIVNALALGVEDAYKAVMNPTEGTILTVARTASERAAQSVKHTNDPVILWTDICSAAEEALAKTPDQLPVLKKAKVVDAGGKGLTIIWNAMLEIFKGGSIPEQLGQSVSSAANTTVGDFDDEIITFTYCTEFIVRKNSGCPDASRLKAFLETIGDCVVAVDDDDIIKVHVHTDHPGKAIEEGLTFGSLINLKIDNMRYQHENKAKDARLTREKNIVPAEPVKDFGFVVVANGSGIEEMFRNLGADCIVRGGQTMNPSTDDIIRAVYSVPAETVFVLPNNKNIIMAAEQAVKLSERKICVIPSRTIPQGMSAMLNYDADGDFDTNRLNMTRAMENVSTGLVTFAARDSEMDGHAIKKGEILGLENGKLAVIEKNVNKAAYKVTKKLMHSGASYVTIIYGADVTENRADELREYMVSKFGGSVDVNFISGAQPVYYYIISVE